MRDAVVERVQSPLRQLVMLFKNPVVELENEKFGAWKINCKQKPLGRNGLAFSFL